MNTVEDDQPAARIHIAPPRLLNWGALLVMSAYGLVLIVPVLLVMLAVSVLQFGVESFVIPLLTITAATFFLPFGFGNPYVAGLVRALKPTGVKDPNDFIVQLTLTPRIRTGLRAIAEDADDIGRLTIGESELVFQGDSVQLSVPFQRIQQLRPQSAGWRGLFVYGRRVELVVTGLPNVTALEFAERSSWILPTSRKNARDLHQCLARSLDSANLKPPGQSDVAGLRSAAPPPP
jgi:hypothetical protein